MSVQAQPLANALPSDDALQSLVGPTRARYIRRIALALDPFLHEIFPQAGQEIVPTLTKLPDGYPATITIRSIAASLGAGNIVVARGHGTTAMALLSLPRVILLTNDHLSDAGMSRVVFETSALLSRVASGSIMSHLIRADQLQALFDVVTDPVVDAPGYRELRKRVGSVLPRRNRKDLERIIEEEKGDYRREWTLWDEEERRRALRVGVLYCRDLRTVAQVAAPDAWACTNPDERKRLLAANPVMVDALRFAVSESCWTAQRKVYGLG